MPVRLNFESNSKSNMVNLFGTDTSTFGAICITDNDIGFTTPNLPSALFSVMTNNSNQKKEIGITSLNNKGKIIAQRVFHLPGGEQRKIRLLGAVDCISKSGNAWASGEDGSNWYDLTKELVQGTIYVWYFHNHRANNYMAFETEVLKDGKPYGVSWGVVEPGAKSAIFSAFPNENVTVLFPRTFIEPL